MLYEGVQKEEEGSVMLANDCCFESGPEICRECGGQHVDMTDTEFSHCLLPKGHEGIHVWTGNSQIGLTWVGD